MTDLYIGVMDKLWEMTPTAPIFIIEGGGQGNYSGLNWGNGFVTDKQIITDYSISDANPLFQTLLSKPYLDRCGQKQTAAAAVSYMKDCCQQHCVSLTMCCSSWS